MIVNNDNNNLKNEVDKIITLFKKKDFQEALYLSDKLIEKKKNIPFLLNLNGLINLNLENWQNAASVFQKAIDFDDKYVEAYNNIGVAYSHMGEDEKAVKNYNRAIQIKKDYSNAYNNLASHYDDIGNYNDAVKNYVNALEFDPKHMNAQNNLIHLINFFDPKKFKNNSIIKANNEIKRINKTVSVYKNISNKSLFDFYSKCKEIVKNNIQNLNFFDSQIHRRNGYNLNCERHHKAFNKYNIIPEYCFSCFKVQIELKTVTQLFKLFFIFDQLKLPKDNIRKCFIELRPGISGTYKGLIYSSSLDDAKNIKNYTKPILDKLIKNNFTVKIKRGCTEFDLAFPGYKDVDSLDQIKYNQNWKIKEKLIDDEILNGSKKGKKVFSRSLSGVSLGDVLIMNNWLNYAKLINDFSYKDITDEIFFSEYIFQAIKKRNIKN